MRVRPIMVVVTAMIKIPVQVVLLDRQDPMAWMANRLLPSDRKDNRVRLENRFGCHRCPRNRAEFAREDRKATTVRWVRAERQDRKDWLDHPAELAVTVDLDRMDQPDRLDQLAKMVILVVKARQVAMPNVGKRDQPDLQAAGEMLVVPVLMAKKETMAIQVVQEAPVQPVPLVKQEGPVPMVHQDQEDNRVHPARTLSTVHVPDLRGKPRKYYKRTTNHATFGEILFKLDPLLF